MLEGKTISYFLVNALKFWQGVMCELTEEELAKWVLDFAIYKFKIFIQIQTSSKRCGTFAYIKDTFRKITIRWKNLQIC